MYISDTEYYRKRLAEERALEAEAETNEIRAVHRKLADLYAQRLASLEAEGPILMARAQTA